MPQPLRKPAQPRRPTAPQCQPRRRTAWAAALPLLACAVLAGIWPPSARAQPAPGTDGYREPVPELKAIVDAPRAPQLTLSPDRGLALLVQMPDLPGIEVVAQPELKLAGLRIHPRVHAPSAFAFGSDLWLMDVGDGQQIRIAGLPQPLGLAGAAWSPDQRWLAFNRIDRASGGNELWLVDVGARRASRLLGGLNTVAGGGWSWLPDSSGLLVHLLAEFTQRRAIAAQARAQFGQAFGHLRVGRGHGFA